MGNERDDANVSRLIGQAGGNIDWVSAKLGLFLTRPVSGGATP
jgi:hypothetical protein